MGLLSERSEDDEERGEISIAGLDALDGAPEETVYDLDDWSEGARRLLADRVEVLGLPHRWEALSLVVASFDEAWAERVMDQVEEELSLSLDPDTEQIAYDLTGWDAANRQLLFDELESEAVPYGIDGEELVIHEIDEDRVDEIIDSIVEPGSEPGRSASGGPEVMGELFVAADRLLHDPQDHEGTLALIDAIRHTGAAPVPYGMDKVWWDSVLAHADGLIELLDAHEADEDRIVEAATALRDALRPYV